MTVPDGRYAASARAQQLLTARLPLGTGLCAAARVPERPRGCEGRAHLKAVKHSKRGYWFVSFQAEERLGHLPAAERPEATGDLARTNFTAQRAD
ncbi:hypothetical protein [Streptomyces mirabilis]